MLSYNELKKGTKIVIEGEPYEVIESSSMKKGRGQAVVQAKIKNLINGNVLSKTIRQSETFEEASLERLDMNYLYVHKDNYFFCIGDNPSKRFSLSGQQVGEAARFLKPQQTVEGIYFNDQIISVSLPIKLSLEVTEAPPGVKGDRSQAGNKTVKLETGARINVPLFIKEGDVVEVNTETGEYVQRMEKKS